MGPLKPARTGAIFKMILIIVRSYFGSSCLQRLDFAESRLRARTRQIGTLVAMSEAHELSTKAKWGVKGLLRTEGVHAGAIEWRFKKPKSEDWLPGSTEIPTAVADEVGKAKEAIRANFQKKFPKVKVVKRNKRGAQPTAMKAVIPPAMKAVIKKPAAKK